MFNFYYCFNKKNTSHLHDWLNLFYANTPSLNRSAFKNKLKTEAIFDLNIAYDNNFIFLPLIWGGFYKLFKQSSHQIVPQFYNHREESR